MYQMNPTSLFSGRATDYAFYRPSYPAEAIATILEQLELPGLIGLAFSQGFVSHFRQEKQQVVTDLHSLYEQGADSSGKIRVIASRTTR